MASGPITFMANRWGNNGTSDTLFPWAPKSLQMDCSHEIKRCFFPWKKNCDQPRQQNKKQRQYFSDKGPSGQGYGFSRVMYRCESWTIKKVEYQRIDAFELWCWRRLLGVTWTARRSNQSIIKEINPEYSLEGLKQKLKFQYSSHLMQRTDAGKD